MKRAYVLLGTVKNMCLHKKQLSFLQSHDLCNLICVSMGGGGEGRVCSNNVITARKKITQISNMSFAIIKYYLAEECTKRIW